MLLKIPAFLGVTLCHWVSSRDVSEDRNALEMSGTSHAVTQHHSPENLNLKQLWLLINFLNDDI